jgi:CHAT domain-containing protein
MRSPRRRAAWVLAVGALIRAAPAVAVELPPTCKSEAQALDETTPLAELRTRVEALAETDPDATIRLLCATIPRVVREQGEDSVDLAWWVASLATPLIAYRDSYVEAIPLLEFARPIFERRLGPYASEIADIHVAYAWIRFRQGRLAESRQSWEEALNVREHTPGPNRIELQKVLVGLAQAQLAQREFPAARISLERARGILEENGEAVSEAAAAIENALTNLEMRQEDFAAARRHAEAQIRIENQLGGGAPQLVPAYALLGNVLERLDEYEESEVALREAVRLAESAQGPLQRHLLAALTLLGSFLDDRGQPQEALELEQRALALGTETLGADAPKLVRVLVNLAEAHRALGQLPEALHAYERAGGIVAAHATDVERQVLVAYYRGLGVVRVALGEPEEAREALRLGLEAAGDDPTLSTARAAVLVALAESSPEPGDPDRRAQLSLALELYRARLPDTHPNILRVINALCALEIESDPGATPDCENASRRLEGAREAEPSLREAVQGNQSLLAERRGDARGAEQFAIRALAAAAALGTPDPLWRSQFRLARLLHARGDGTLAVLVGKAALGQVERLRGAFVGDDRRFDHDFVADKVAVYRAVADWLMEAGRIDEGLEVVRLLKGEELYDFALRDATWTQGERELDLTESERAILDRYTEALAADAAAAGELARLSRLRETSRLSVREGQELERRLAGQVEIESARAERLQAFLVGNAPKPDRAPSTGRPLESTALKAEAHRWGDDSALAFYLLTDTHLRLLVATRRGETEFRIPVDAGALRRDIGRFLASMGRREEVLDASHALYETIAKPLDDAAREAGAKRLVLWLDGALRYVPFGALRGGGRYLAEAYAIEVQVGAAGRPIPPGGGGAMRVRGLGVTRAVAGYQALPAVGDELCYVVRGPITGLAMASAACPAPDVGNGALAGAGFADAAFTRERLEALLSGTRDFSVLHLGTHFSLRPGNALRSFLLLGDGSKLTLDAIGGLDFSGIELLTLSSCQTGLGGAVTEDGREVEGLSAIVTRRGARRVVASLWEVEDSSTALLMRSLYGSLRAVPGDIPVALRDAQAALRAVVRDGRHPYEHPYYWAGFVVSGREL